MKSLIKAFAVILSVTLLGLGLSSCKKQEAPEPDPVLTDVEFKTLASTSGANFFEAFRVRNTTNMATLSQEDLRSDFIDNIENYYNYVQNSDWIEVFYNSYLCDVQVVESTFTRVDNEHGEIAYKIIIANYNSAQTGALVSYDVVLKFVANAKTSSVYVINPDLAIQLYEDMVDDYARFLLDNNYSKLSEPSPTPVPVDDPATTDPNATET